MRRSPASLLALCVAAPTIAVLAVAPASAAAFSSGDVVVEQVGANGNTTALSGTSVPVFLDEVSSAGTPVQQIPLPTTASGSTLALTDSGSAGSDGQITNSADGRYLLTTGYNAPVGTASVTGTTSASTARVIGRINAAGTVDTSTSASAAFSGNNIRSATSSDGSAVLSAGASTSPAPAGVQTEALGSSTTTNYSAGTENVRVVHVFGGLTFVSGAAASAPGGINLVNPPSGTTAGSLTAVPGIPGGSSTSTYGFAMLRTGSGPTYLSTGLDTIYAADSSTGVTKYVWSGSTFTATGTVATPASGLAARFETVNGTSVPVLYFASGTNLYRLADTSPTGTFTGTPTSLAVAGTNTAFRGVAFAPALPAVTTAPSSLPEAPYAVLLPLIGLTGIGAFSLRRSARSGR